VILYTTLFEHASPVVQKRIQKKEHVQTEMPAVNVVIVLPTLIEITSHLD